MLYTLSRSKRHYSCTQQQLYSRTAVGCQAPDRMSACDSIFRLWRLPHSLLLCAFFLLCSSEDSCAFSLLLFLTCSLVHDVCTTFHASVQVNRNLVLQLLSRETIAIEVSIGTSIGCVQGIRVWVYIKVSGYLSQYQDIRII